ncbi:putative uncharacterized protein DDB_G0282133 isoform X2 [Nilaparvata lugens]|uniref:putative uncharacterized protein DDB_G0282133 isoform X2 n=1 Tax=Nilaparvata lugens TaxID=108931 RepID=UPI00193E6D4C|nr:putative uncharacterized protein DDB_G0282133 isoform X2 [Nilaparvata lugens]
MESKDIELLTMHIDLLMKANNVDALLNELLDRKVLSEYIAYQLKMIPNEEIRLKTLFEELKSRGPAAFEHLLSSLVITGNEDICDKLNEFKNPSSVYSKIKVIKAVTPLDVEDGSSMKIYRMRSSPRGYALIINIHEFFEPIKSSDDERRHGSYRDVANLYSLFSQLGYKVRMHYNLTKKEIHDKVSSFAEMPEHASVDSTVVVVMSHGGRYHDTFRAYDNLLVHCDKDVVAHFTNHKSEHLHGKPKIFIFQICRGNQNDHGKLVANIVLSTTQDIAEKSTSDATGSSTVGKTSSSTVVEPGLSTSLSTVDVTGLSTTVDRTSSDAFRWATGNSTTSSDGRIFELPNYDEPVDQLQSDGRQRQSTVTVTREARVNNIFKIYSSTFDYQSIRDWVKGSYFVDIMCQIFAAEAHRLELRDLLHETANVVTSIYDRRYGIMTPSITCSADFGKLYFNPGIDDETTFVTHQVSDRNDGDSSGGNTPDNGDRIDESDRINGNCREDTERNVSNRNDDNCGRDSERNVSNNSSDNDDRIDYSNRDYGNSCERNTSDNDDRIDESDRINGNCREDTERNVSNRNDDNCREDGERNVCNNGDRIDDSNRNHGYCREDGERNVCDNGDRTDDSNKEISNYREDCDRNVSNNGNRINETNRNHGNCREDTEINSSNNSEENTSHSSDENVPNHIDRNNENPSEFRDINNSSYNDAIVDNSSFPNNSNRNTRNNSDYDEAIDTVDEAIDYREINNSRYDEKLVDNTSFPNNSNTNTRNNSDCNEAIDTVHEAIDYRDMNNSRYDEKLVDNTSFPNNSNRNTRNNSDYDEAIDTVHEAIDYRDMNNSRYDDKLVDNTSFPNNSNRNTSSEIGNIFENINMNFVFCDRGNRAINRNKTSNGFDTIITSSVDSRSLVKDFENRADVDENGSKKCAIIKSSPENSENSVEKQADSRMNEQNVVAVEKQADNEQNVVAVEKQADNEQNVVAVEKQADNEQNVVAVEKQADNKQNVVAVEKQADNKQNVVAVEKQADNEQNVLDEVDNNFENCKSVINYCSESEKLCTEVINSQKECVANFEHDVQIASNEISVLAINEDVKQSCETNSIFYVPCDDSSEDQFLVKNLAETENKGEGCAKRKNWAVRKYFRKTEGNVDENDKETGCFDKNKCELS